MDDPDYAQLVERIRTHSAEASGSDTERVTIRTLESMDVDALFELRNAIDDEAAPTGELEFILSQTNADEVVDDEVADVDELADRLSSPVRVEDGMPDDAVLLLDPDAVEDGELREPSGIACGTLRGTSD